MIFERKFLELSEDLQSGRKISYLDWNEKSDKVVFCVHALLCNSRDFDYIANAISDDFRVVCIDLPGRGESDYLIDRNRYSYDTYISDIMKLIDFLNLKNITWIGSSLGGVLGFFVNSLNPFLISKFIVNDVGNKITKKTMVYLLASLRSFEFKNFYEEQEMRNLIKDMFKDWNISLDSHWNHVFEINTKKVGSMYSFNFDPQVIEAVKAIPESLPVTEFDFSNVWNQVNAPILQFFGAKSKFVTQDMIDYMISVKPEMSVVKSLHGGHICNFRNDDQVDLINKWIRSERSIEKFNCVD